jgi:hypothetical protein
MSRPSELFATCAIALLLAGLALPRFTVFYRVFVDVSIHDTYYALFAKTPLFGLAALFGVFAFVYSIWILRISQSAAIWHFWLSIIGVVLFFSEFVVFAVSSPPTSASSLSRLQTAAMFGTFLACVVFLAGQLVFVTNLVLALTRAKRTP